MVLSDDSPYCSNFSNLNGTMKVCIFPLISNISKYLPDIIKHLQHGYLGLSNENNANGQEINPLTLANSLLYKWSINVYVQ